MFISKKRWQALVKRVADLEGQVQSQQEVNIKDVLSLTHKELHCIRRIMEFQNATPRSFLDPDSHD
jgi:hypothetical protein